MGEMVLTSRDKNDLFWVKKRRYMVSSEVKGTTNRGYFNPEMAAEVKGAYDRYDKGHELYDLNGNEFMDHPATASGQMSFAKSIAMMMHTLDDIEASLADGNGGSDPTASFFSEILEEAGELIRDVINAFFTGCGVDADGNETIDRKKRNEALEEFYEKRKEYEVLIKTEKRIAGSEMIDVIRESNGIEERIETDLSGEDEGFEELIAGHSEAADACGEKIDQLRAICKEAITEAAECEKGRRELWDVVRKTIEDESQNDHTRSLLKPAFDSYSFDVDMNIRRLLYKREAAYYLARWLVCREPVDGIIAVRIAEISDEKPDILDGEMQLSEVPGFVKPVEKTGTPLKDPDDPDEISALGEKIQKYLYTHPYQFESQCLLSILNDTEELMDHLSMAGALVDAIDRITLSDRFRGMNQSDAQKLYEVWVKADIFSRIGDTVMEIVIENCDNTVREATDAITAILPTISYYAVEKESSAALKQIILERGGFNVY